MSEPISKGGTAHPRLTRQQKAAAVIVSLGTDKASQLYQYMDPEDVEQITLEVAKLGYLDSSATEDVLTEYYQMCMTNKAVTEGGLEYARAVLEKAFGQQTATSLLEKVTKSLKNREFAFLNKADEKSLYAALQHERPQTIALVLSYVDAEKSAAVIEELDDERQVRVIENMANMESASPTAVKIIEAEMEKKFSSLMTASNVKVGGVDFVADVMNNLDRSSEKTSLTAWPSTTSLWRMRSASACLCLRTSLPWMTVRCSALSGTAIPEIWCWRSRAQTAMWPTKFSPICRPAWRRASGRIWRSPAMSASGTWRRPSSALLGSSGTWRNAAS